MSAAPPVIAGLAVGIAFMISFSVSTTCAGFIQRPTMKLLIEHSQYVANGGSMDTKCFHADGSFNPPKEGINMTSGTEISLVVWRYSQPDSLEVRAESLTDDDRGDFVYLKKSGSSKYIVDLPAGDYALVVTARWDEESLSVGRAIY